ncbi:MAG: ferritin-like domain-containing protein [Archangium sp.]|nr:ferritin-like domain-containing protein [Archangium sp.]
MRTRFRNEDDFKKWMRRLALGAAASAPLISAAGCGRTESNDFSVIPNAQIVVARRDGGLPDAGRPDSGTPDSGFVDAGYDAGIPDAGTWKSIIYGCSGWAYNPEDGGNIVFDGGGLLDPQLCMIACPVGPGPTDGCQTENNLDLICWYQFCGVGRLTNGVQTSACGVGALGRELANMASHEAGAALAFAQLARELDRHGVSPQFSRRARRAAREEVRHAQLVGRLARAHGGRFGVTQPIDTGRTLEALALENATEGCVRETLGALIGLHQSRHASDTAVRAVMAEVSRDELGHASWSHALADQLDGQLSLAARRRVREARAEALLSATRELSAAPSRAIDATLGLPDGERINTMAVALT